MSSFNFKEKTSQILGTCEMIGKTQLLKLATLALLAWAFTGCERDRSTIQVSFDKKSVSTDFYFIRSVGEWDYEKKRYDLKVVKKDGLCIAVIDGPWSDNYEFSGTPTEVFDSVQAVLQSECEEWTNWSKEVASKVFDKLIQVKRAYDDMATWKDH